MKEMPKCATLRFERLAVSATVTPAAAVMAAVRTQLHFEGKGPYVFRSLCFSATLFLSMKVGMLYNIHFMLRTTFVT